MLYKFRNHMLICKHQLVDVFTTKVRPTLAANISCGRK